MKTATAIIFTIFLTYTASTQQVKFDKSALRIKEPYEDGKEKTEKFEITLIAKDIPKDAPISASIEISSESTFPTANITLHTSNISPLEDKNTIELSIKTYVWQDEESFIVLTANYKKASGETVQVKDTLYVENTFPYRAKAVYEKDWKDGKRAEIFIGTNFDFINNKVTTSDWYGGARVFLPEITEMRFNKDKSSRIARWGILAGIYHAKSLSNFGNTFNDPFPTVYKRVLGMFTDTINGIPTATTDLRSDTMNTKIKTEINNWGLYFTPMFLLSRYESNDGNFITNISVGFHTEVIRRNQTISYSFDSTGNKVERIPVSRLPRFLNLIPKTQKSTFYDVYFGLSLPIQFLWKDILDLKINPCFGVGPANFNSSDTTEAAAIKDVPKFYLVQFDLLARLGGIRLNIGGMLEDIFRVKIQLSPNT